MRVTYLHHSAFWVELAQSRWLFDAYERPQITLPADKPVYVCASHSHPDHFNAEIFAWFGANPQVHFVLAKQIRHPDNERYGVPDSRVLRVAPNRSYAVPDGSIQTLKSTDAGVAFVVQTENVHLYHAGDLNWWAWPDDTAEEAAGMKQAYWAQLDKLRGQHFDLAFVPLDPRLGDQFDWGLDAFARTMQADRIFPMHFWDDYTVIPRLKALPESAGYRDRVVELREQNQIFSWEDKR